MSTDTQSRSTADRVVALQSARARRDLDPALSSPPAPGGTVEHADVVDLAVGTAVPSGIPDAAPEGEVEGLAPLFQPLEAQGFRDAWDAVQVGFVDDPKGAVHHADALVKQVMESLAASFAEERPRLESQAQAEQASTEDLRLALRRYRSFLQRLLAF